MQTKIIRKKILKNFLHIFVIFIIISHKISAQDDKVFPISTEFQIGKIKPMIERAPAGVYVSVGSERSFRVASMIPQFTDVYLLDISPKIIRFNRINIALLKIPSRERYCHFRWNASYEEWKNLNLNLSREDFEWWQNNVRNLDNMLYPLSEILNRHEGYPYAQKFLKIRQKLYTFYHIWRSKETPIYPKRQFIEIINYDQLKNLAAQFNIPLEINFEEWKWWETCGRNREYDCSRYWLDNPEEAVDIGQIIDFKTGNYLFNDDLYERIHNLAIHNKFINLQIDLGNNIELENFLSHLKLEKKLISVLDLNNLFFQDYLGQETYNKLVKKFLSHGQDKSLLIVMHNYKDYACTKFQLYIGFTFRNIYQWPEFFYMQSFMDTLPKGLLDIIDGRIYDKDEHPPYQYLLDNE